MEILDKHDFGVLFFLEASRFLSEGLEIGLQRCVEVEDCKCFKHGSKEHDCCCIVVSQVREPR